ncbi:uncharacterized protein LOC119674150 [Teleopsis dalmanni]|uniref:uncharacterized protein LOC119674150 n=1 Tax=Teleopsis dalmanni TaxID=139649 RepID=UPI0018CF42BD|nr:uncharacterized protein LOC119674150 [Teleopsis dalmanni]
MHFLASCLLVATRADASAVTTIDAEEDIVSIETFASALPSALEKYDVLGATSLAAVAAADVAAAALNSVKATATATPTSLVESDTISSSSSPTSASMGRSHGDNKHRNDFISNSANLLLQDIQQHADGLVVNLTRHHDGDIFHTNGVSRCISDTCVGLSSGTAGLHNLGGDKKGKLDNLLSEVHASLAGGNNGQSELLTKRIKTKTTSNTNDAESCQCRCLPYLSTYREDLRICVDDIHECSLSPFVSGSSSEKIPFVFLPLRGQIIYPSREISFPDIRTPVCAVTGAQYLTTNGWSDLRNPIDTDYPFRMFRDEGRTFLQWLGEADLRHKMQGRLIVVHLVCRDMTIALNGTIKKEYLKPPKNIFSPCVAFRVNGSPVKYFHNVSEVLFQAEATTTLASTSDGMTSKEYIVIGICSLLLGLIYVSSVFLYLHMKKRKQRDQLHMRRSLDDLANEINYPKNDQVTFGTPFNRSGSMYSIASLSNSNEPRSRGSIGSLKEEIGIIKNNPLLQHFPQLGEHNSGFTSDVSNSNSECEMDGSFHDKIKQLQTAALIHPQLNSNGNLNGTSTTSGINIANEDVIEPCASPTQDNECLPVENVSIIEDMMTEEKLENLRALVNGNVRRKLYFNPAYFEPHLLAQPPPAAVEFLQKIREVIAIAKYKMATKRYQPSLIMIPEEVALASQTSSLYSAQMQTSTECQGCANNRCSGHVKNCGDKRNSIEKWLQSVPTTDKSSSEQRVDTSTAAIHTSRSNQITEEKQFTTSKNSANNNKTQTPQGNNRNSPRKEITAPKQKPPPPPIHASNRSKLQSPKTNVIKIMHTDSVTTQNSSSTDFLNYSTNSVNNASISIPINRNYDAFSALSAAANFYGFAETGGELYNNPKFNLHDSPSASMRSRGSSHRSKNSRRRLEALDQYAVASTPTSLTSADRQHYQMLRNMKQIADLVYEEKDYNNTLKSNESFQLDIPTPDYDSTMEKKTKDIYNTHSTVPSVPTPDYSTLSRKSLKNGQPDSPIYRRKSPQYLIVDYETDSLERLEVTKRKSSQSSSSPSSDISSQLSPSLSTALPLEEELEISHTVKLDGFRKDSELKKKHGNKTESGTKKQKEIAARIKYDTPFRGSMTIEVEHEPNTDIEQSTDSEQFDPDTLDRNTRKQSFCDVNSWSGQPNASYTNHKSNETEKHKHINISSSTNKDLMRKRSNSFEENSEGNSAYETRIKRNSQLMSNEDNFETKRPSVGSLRDFYQSQLVRQNSQNSCKCGGQARQLVQQQTEAPTENGRLLTLEAKHSRRQRLIEPPTSQPQPIVEITKVAPNKTTIKISTPKVCRATPPILSNNDTIAESVKQSSARFSPTPSIKSTASNIIYDWTKHSMTWNLNKTPTGTHNANGKAQKKLDTRAPAPLPITSTSGTLNSEKSYSSSRQSYQHHYQNEQQFKANATEEETNSTHSEFTEVTRVSETVTNSEFDESCSNTLSSVIHNQQKSKDFYAEQNEQFDSSRTSIIEKSKCGKNLDSPQLLKKQNSDYGALFNTKLNGLRNDYSLTKYLNRRKNHEQSDDENFCNNNSNEQATESNNNQKNIAEMDVNKLDVISISSRSNRSSSRLSDRTKELYRNAGVPVGIAYPQRSTAGSTNSQSTSTVQTVYRCEIEPVQLTHGMQIAMGLKDRAKKTKDLKNAWKKFVSMAASKFSPTQSPAPPFDKKTSTFLEVLDRDEGISSLIDDQPQISTPKSSYSAPASQNYYEQRFGVRTQEMDSGYMSADSGEVYKRSFYDRYNFKLMSGRDHIIRIDTIEDNSDSGSVLTERNDNNATSMLRGNKLEDRFEDFENMGDPPPNELCHDDDNSDADSDKTLTRNTEERFSRCNGNANLYSSEDEQGHSPSYGSSETDGETNAEDMWESGAESVETHSVLYKNVRKN